MVDLPSLAAARTWRDGRGADIPTERLAETVREPGSLTWVDLLAPSPGELDALAAELGLGVTAVEDALAPHERPKVTRHATHVFCTVYATRLAERDDGGPPVSGDGLRGRLRISRVSAFVLPTALITIRLDEQIDMQPVRDGWEDNADLLPFGVGALVHGLLDTIVDGHFETIQRLDDALEELEDLLFEHRRTGPAFAHRVYGLRKDLVALRRVVLPMREVVAALLRHHTPIGSELDAWFDDLQDHVLRAADWTESLRDLVGSIFETNLSLQDARLNEILKKLAGWAAIIAAPTAITGWFGQNIPFLGSGRPLGLFLSVTSILACSLALYVAFRRRDWL